MSRWFRHYAGMMRDEKLVGAAMRSKQPVERVVWVWGAILESAAEINDHGRFVLDTAEAAYFLRADQAELDDIISALETLGRLSEGRVAKWGNRQFSSDSSAERTRNYRGRSKEKNKANVTKTVGDGYVTVIERHSDAPETETETETEKKEDYSLRSDARGDVRCETPKAKKRTAGSKTPLPDDWQPSVMHRAAAARLKLPSGLLESKAEDMRIWAASNGVRKANWDMTFHGFLKRAASEAGNGNGQRGSRPLHDDSRSLGKAADRLIDQAERGEFKFGPRPSLLPQSSENDVLLLPKR